MGLDVSLYQFKDIDTDTLLKLWQFLEEPWAYEEFQKWSALPSSAKGPFPSKEAVADSLQKLSAKARELGLPEIIVSEHVFGGTKISFPSEQHPAWMVGDWYSFSTTRGIIEHFTGNDFYFIFPEAKNIHGLFRPDWIAARTRLAGILLELKKIEPVQFESFITGLSNSIDHHLSQIEVFVETLDYVLNSENPKEFLLYWSN